MTVNPFPQSILTQCSYIMSGYSVALLFLFLFFYLLFLFLTANSNNSVSGLLWCLARLTKPTLKDSGRDNHSTSAASFCDL